MSGHTATEKILALKGGKKEVFPGDIVTCDVDMIFLHSPWLTIPMWDELGQVKSVFDGEKVVFGLGHHVCLPASQEYATDLKNSRMWAKKYNVKHVYDMGSGNGHILVIENGHVWPGALAVGGDSHSTVYGVVGAFGTALTYEISEILLSGRSWFKVPQTMRVVIEGNPPKGVSTRDVGQFVLKMVGPDGALWRSLDFTGEYIKKISVYQRMIFSLLAVEMGAVTGFIEPDEKTIKFVKNIARS
ncbi:MAG: aconitase family protein, partial [Bacillota bacterium]|nr:aconitase family protein [Bacillota bacterium]